MQPLIRKYLQNENEICQQSHLLVFVFFVNWMVS